MAESASAAPSGPGAKGAWWKSLTTSRKKPKEALAAAAAPATSWPPRQPAEPSELLPTPPSPSDLRENQQPNAGSRRNLKISRSGRFKEKRKVRATLLAAETSPQQLFEGGGPPGRLF
uniref:Proline-rich protein 15 n=1 Tax=Salvator merianae TaxID=96440 RepID=A0A8D0B6M2_SALMN